MSFLGGRLAGREAAYFVEESRQSVSRYLEKNPQVGAGTGAKPSKGDGADILPEVLRHSLPPKFLQQQPMSDYSSPVSTPAKWAVRSPAEESRYYGASPDVMNPLRGYLSLPQVTFGPKRWQLPEMGNSVPASTANELLGKALGGATAVIFGGAALTFGLAASTFHIHTREDIRVQGRDLVQPSVDTLKERLLPLRTWVDQVSKKWRLQVKQDIKEKPFIREISKRFRSKRSE